MSNPYFQFKKFRVEQDQCAMKVTTDACIQGAWTSIPPDTNSVLDIGAGTGLLSLMLAQRDTEIRIDAIEIDENAAIQAKSNIQSSPWHNRINLIHGDAKKYTSAYLYDLIICNPPFFINSLLGKNEHENHAKHNLVLTLENLITIIANLLTQNGCASILLPFEENKQWLNLCKNSGFFEIKRLEIKHNKDQNAKRIISIISRICTEPIIETLVITANHSGYTPEFIQLLKDFYLHL